MFKVLFAFFLLVPLWAKAGAELFDLKSDKSVYGPGEKAILVTNIQSLPDNSNLEVVIKTVVNSTEVETIKLSETQFISKIDKVGQGPEVTFVSRYYVRDKYEASDFERAIEVDDLAIFELVKTRRMASAQERATIDSRISKLEQRIGFYQQKLESLLRLVQEKTLVAMVQVQSKALQSAFIFVDSDRDESVYTVGENLTLFGHVYAQVSDKETLVKARIGETVLKVEKLLNDEFLILSEALTPASIGAGVATIELYLRDETRSSKLIEALDSIRSEISRLQSVLNETSDEAQRHSIERMIDDLEQLKAHIEGILVGLEQLIETVKFHFTVREA